VQAKQAEKATKNKTHNRELGRKTWKRLKTSTNAAGQLGIFAGGGGETRRSIKAKALPKKRNYLLKRRQRTLSGASFFPEQSTLTHPHTHTHTHTQRQTKNNKN